MTPTASGLDEARERLRELAGDFSAGMGLPTYCDPKGRAADLRAILASEAALREALKLAVENLPEPDGLRKAAEGYVGGMRNRMLTEADDIDTIRRAARPSQDAGS